MYINNDFSYCASMRHLPPHFYKHCFDICPNYPGFLPPHDMYYPNYYSWCYYPSLYTGKKCCQYTHRVSGAPKSVCIDYGNHCPTLPGYDSNGYLDVDNCGFCR